MPERELIFAREAIEYMTDALCHTCMGDYKWMPCYKLREPGQKRNPLGCYNQPCSKEKCIEYFGVALDKKVAYRLQKKKQQQKGL